MYFLSVYNREEKRWELEEGSENTKAFTFLPDAAKAFALAVKINGVANVKLLQQVPAITAVSVEINGALDCGEIVTALA